MDAMTCAHVVNVALKEVAGVESVEVIALAVDPKDADASAAAGKQIDRVAVLRGVMMPGKDFKAAVPLQIGEVK